MDVLCEDISQGENYDVLMKKNATCSPLKAGAGTFGLGLDVACWAKSGGGGWGASGGVKSKVPSLKDKGLLPAFPAPDLLDSRPAKFWR